ncbi:TetR/AcrR family transcriptional regulator [Microbispora sp. ATCC PTA-5024]|uniref:TetR/AcrR family transcriptional regulator n=1 Tax=Microbispora sp. ATCC PTA-5024 TaxID=316330 RepID=UPI0003DDDB5A|nr:TetR/AcrR family transcriptional regulator [Microbispora sp. ATCC PTA-5024]ETK30533.1 TetR family transcriptional regulator [Microbispora sp. ATCC PTA-5024]
MDTDLRAAGGASARDRLLLAAAQLLETGDRSFSTRAVCDLAGVKAPTLYHHFGNKQGLVDAVLLHGFTQYVSPSGSPEASSDPVRDLRHGWDRHVEFGLDHPSFYTLLYGGVEPGRPCTVTAPATDMLVRLLDEVARRGLLRVPPAEAAAQILAANVGVTLSLIAQPEGERDLRLSERVREAALAAVLTGYGEGRAPEGDGPSRATAAIALAAAVERDDSGLTPGESLLLRELLARLGEA